MVTCPGRPLARGSPFSSPPAQFVREPKTAFKGILTVKTHKTANVPVKAFSPGNFAFARDSCIYAIGEAAFLELCTNGFCTSHFPPSSPLFLLLTVLPSRPQILPHDHDPPPPEPSSAPYFHFPALPPTSPHFPIFSHLRPYSLLLRAPGASVAPVAAMVVPVAAVVAPGAGMCSPVLYYTDLDMVSSRGC